MAWSSQWRSGPVFKHVSTFEKRYYNYLPELETLIPVCRADEDGGGPGLPNLLQLFSIIFHKMTTTDISHTYYIHSPDLCLVYVELLFPHCQVCFLQ